MNRQIHKLKNSEKLRIKIRNIDIVKRFKNNMKLSEEFLSTVKPSIFMKLIYFIKSLKHG